MSLHLSHPFTRH